MSAVLKRVLRAYLLTKTSLRVSSIYISLICILSPPNISVSWLIVLLEAWMMPSSKGSFVSIAVGIE